MWLTFVLTHFRLHNQSLIAVILYRCTSFECILCVWCCCFSYSLPAIHFPMFQFWCNITNFMCIEVEMCVFHFNRVNFIFFVFCVCCLLQFDFCDLVAFHFYVFIRNYLLKIACGEGNCNAVYICFNDLSMPLAFGKFTFDFHWIFVQQKLCATMIWIIDWMIRSGSFSSIPFKCRFISIRMLNL